MIISNTNLKDAVIIEMEKHQDNRGFFGRVWDEKIFHHKEEFQGCLIDVWGM